MLDPKIEQSIERFTRYIRRMNSLNNEQLKTLLKIKIDESPDYYTSIGMDVEGHIRFIRDIAMYDDDAIRKYLRDQIEVNKDPVFYDIFTDAAKKKDIADVSKMAKDIKSDPRSFARRIV